MTVEVFLGKSDGRVFSGSCVTTVSGGPGDPITPECSMTRVSSRGTRDVAWTGEDDRRVEQLREMWASKHVPVR